MALTLPILGCLALEGGLAWAEQAAQSDARLLSADQNSPTSSLARQRELRGKVGVRIPVVEDSSLTGFAFYLSPLIELQNRPSTAEVVPYEYWRGRVSLEPLYRSVFHARERDLAWSLGLPVEHESDHPTGGSFEGGWLTLNTVGGRSDLTVPMGEVFLTISALLRWHFSTCTADPDVCAGKENFGGSSTLETAFDLVVDSPLGGNRWHCFLATHGSWLFPHGLATEEKRLVFDVGVSRRTARGGLFQIFVDGLAGHDVGYFRATSAGVAFGAGIRWGL